MAGDATIGLEDLKAKVTELYKFRDHFFEENGLSEARGKAGQVGERKAALLEVFRVKGSSGRPRMFSLPERPSPKHIWGVQS